MNYPCLLNKNQENKKKKKKKFIFFSNWLAHPPNLMQTTTCLPTKSSQNAKPFKNRNQTENRDVIEKLLFSHYHYTAQQCKDCHKTNPISLLFFLSPYFLQFLVEKAFHNKIGNLVYVWQVFINSHVYKQIQMSCG